MSISPDAITSGSDSGEALYASPSTRVVRFAATASSSALVCKEHLGPHAAQRLRNEKELLRRLAGIEGVAQIAGDTPGAGMLALRDCGGASLASLIQAGRCDTRTVVSLACQLARILGEVHRVGVIHRDINPSNIIVSAAGEAVLIDFDLALAADPNRSAEPGGQIVGTLNYIAPEQTGRTGHAVDPRADLYALGATLYEMATGRPPFERADALQLIHDHLVREPVAPSQVNARVPRGLSDIIVRLLAKAPEQRYENLEQRVQARTEELRRTQAELVKTARRAGMAEIATNVLHNVGNLLNSVNVAAKVLGERVRGSRAAGLSRAVALMNEHAGDLGGFITRDERGRHLPAYLGQLARALEGEASDTLKDLETVDRSVENIRAIIRSQQSYAGVSTLREPVDVNELIEEALRVDAVAGPGAIEVVREGGPLPVLPLDKPRLMQILVNLIVNARDAMGGEGAGARRLTLGAHVVDADAGRVLRITVRDEGHGIAENDLPRLFTHGFTTKKNGHGFGLHSSAVAAMEMGGKLAAQSEGVGRGATFTLEVPVGR